MNENEKSCLHALKIKQRKLSAMKTKITFFSPIDSFILILSSAHQQSFTKYFEAVFIGIFRTLPNMESFARV